MTISEFAIARVTAQLWVDEERLTGTERDWLAYFEELVAWYQEREKPK